MSESKRFWAVMEVYPWKSVQLNGEPLMSPDKGQPQRIIPVFDNRDDAVAWAGSEEDVEELQSK